MRTFLEWHGYVVGRVVKAFLTIFVVASGTFFLVRLLPGNPVDVYINAQIAQYGLSYDEAASQAAGLFSFNPNEPMIVQYLTYLAGLVRGDLGDSLLSPGTSVLTLIGTCLPWTLFSVGIGLIISFVVGGSILVEQVFQNQGIGFLLFEAASDGVTIPSCKGFCW